MASALLAATAILALLWNLILEKAALKVSNHVEDDDVEMTPIPADIKKKSPVAIMANAFHYNPRLSYAEVVGYEHVEVRRARNPPPIGFDVCLGDLFAEPTITESNVNNHESPKIQVKRRLSYAEVVGYEHVEVRRARNPPPIGYAVYLGTIFA